MNFHPKFFTLDTLDFSGKGQTQTNCYRCASALQLGFIPGAISLAQDCPMPSSVPDCIVEFPSLAFWSRAITVFIWKVFFGSLS